MGGHGFSEGTACACLALAAPACLAAKHLRNSVVPKRLVSDVPCRAFQRGWFHQTILNNCPESTTRHSGSSRRYTSGAKSAWEAVFLPDVIRPENREVPQSGLEGRLAISRRYTSGAKSVWEADFLPDVTRSENREGQNGEGKRRNGVGKCHREFGIALFQNV